ncbi:MAG: hypothetical protein IIX39_00365 [Clostridia bacterium]|nr:hypothetical protein [Clostridia bacterium]
MKFQTIMIIIEVVVLIVGMVLFKIFPKSNLIKNDKVVMIADWAYRFVVNARNILPVTATGEEKKDNVLSQLKTITQKYNVDFNDTELSALIEEAYEKMKSVEVNKSVS